MAVPECPTLMLPGAEDYVKRVYESGVGVRTRRTLDVKRVDEAYFEGDV